jgi:hypothetical protein
MEQAVFSQSFSGGFVQTNLPGLILPAVAPPERPAGDSIKKKMQDVIDNPMGAGKK